MNRSSQNIWAKLDQYPPVLVRLLARNRDGTAMSDQQIVDASAEAKYPLNRADVKWLSSLTSWVEVQVSDLETFVKACRLDFANREQMRNANRYINKDPKFTHLRRDKNFLAFQELLKVFYESRVNS